MAKWDLSKLPEGRKPLPDEWFAERAQMQERIKGLEAQVKKDALQYLSDTGQMGETIGDLKDQLAKAIEALRITDRWLRELDMYANPDYHLVPSLQKVRDTLAELTGGEKNGD